MEIISLDYKLAFGASWWSIGKLCSVLVYLISLSFLLLLCVCIGLLYFYPNKFSQSINHKSFV